MSSYTTKAQPHRFLHQRSSDRRCPCRTITGQDVPIAQRVIGSGDCQMPCVPLRALVVYEEALLRICPARGTLCNNIMCVTNIAGGHYRRSFAQGEKWIFKAGTIHQKGGCRLSSFDQLCTWGEFSIDPRMRGYTSKCIRGGLLVFD